MPGAVRRTNMPSLIKTGGKILANSQTVTLHAVKGKLARVIIDYLHCFGQYLALGNHNGKQKPEDASPKLVQLRFPKR